MNNPASFDANIDFIIERIAQFAMEGPAGDLFQAGQRRQFLGSATRMLREWRAAKPCPITYRNLYAREAELVRYIGALGKDVGEAIETWGDAKTNGDTSNPPDDPFGYTVDCDGIVTRVLPWVLDKHWPELEALPANLRPQPRYKVGDRLEPIAGSSRPASAHTGHPLLADNATVADDGAEAAVGTWPPAYDGVIDDIENEASSGLGPHHDGVDDEPDTIGALALSFEAERGEEKASDVTTLFLSASNEGPRHDFPSASPSAVVDLLAAPGASGASSSVETALAALLGDKFDELTKALNGRLTNSVAPGPLLSAVLDRFLDELALVAGGLRSADKDIRPYIEFWIYILGDKPLAEYTREDALAFCAAINDVPHPKGMQAQTPIARYEHVRNHGWAGLNRLTKVTLENRYFTAVRRVYGWARDAKLASCDTPKLKVVGEEVMSSLTKDAFSDTEVQALFSLPMFSGQQRNNSQAEGPFLEQDWAYWGYLILYLAGLRPGEIAQLEIDDIRDSEGILHFDMRPFDPEKGRVALKNMKNLKTENASRLVPIHPVLIELGLLERASKLKALGHTRLFPDWKWRTIAGGKVKHGDALARDWQKRKKGVTARANVSAYSGRHSMADLLDRLNIPNRDRERILGHSHPGVTGRYGRKRALPDDIVQAFVNHDSEIVRWLRRHLVAVRDRAERDRKLVTDWVAKPRIKGG